MDPFRRESRHHGVYRATSEAWLRISLPIRHGLRMQSRRIRELALGQAGHDARRSKVTTVD
jgi:hypothetical protein